MVPGSPSMVVIQSSRHGPSWSRMLLALSFLLGAFTGTGFLFKQFFGKLKAWIRGVISEECSRALPFQKKPAEEAAIAAAVAAKAASAAASEVASANREMIKIHAEERGYVSHSIRALEAHALELTKAITSIRLVMEAANKARQPVSSKVEPYDRQHGLEIGKSPITSFRKVNSTATSNSDATSNGGSGQSLEPTSLNRLESAPHSTSYLKVMEMLERGETPPGIQEINDKPPKPNQPPSVARLQPKPKPWETCKIDGAMSVSEVKTFPLKMNTDSTLKQGNGASRSVQKYESVSVEHEKGFLNSVPRYSKGKVEMENQSISVGPAETSVKSLERENAREIPAEASASAGNQEKLRTSTEMPHGSEVSRRVWTPPPISEISMPGAAAAIYSWRGVVPPSAQSSAASIQESLKNTAILMEPNDTVPLNKEEPSVMVADGVSVGLSTPDAQNGADQPKNLHSQGVQDGTYSSLKMDRLPEESCSPRVAEAQSNTEATSVPACEDSTLLPEGNSLTQEGAQEGRALGGTKQERQQISACVDVQDVAMPGPDFKDSEDRHMGSVEASEDVPVAQFESNAVTIQENLSISSNAHFRNEEPFALQQNHAVRDEASPSLHTHDLSKETFLRNVLANDSEGARSDDAKGEENTVVKHPMETHVGPVEPDGHAEENIEHILPSQSASGYTPVEENTPEPLEIEEVYDSVHPSSNN